MDREQELFDTSYETRLKRKMINMRWRLLHIDPTLFALLLLLAFVGLLILYSASNENMHMVYKQLFRLGLSFTLMIGVSQISPRHYAKWAPWLFGIGVLLLLAVLVIGKVDLGARRWLSFGFFRFQPSEIMKLAMPMMLAWYLQDKNLPPSPRTLLMCAVIVVVPFLLIAKEPDLGTAIIVGTSAFIVLVLAGISARIVLSLVGLAAAMSPVVWHFMHAYQKQRVLTFLNPSRDPLGHGYHIIQSKIAIGSGGIFGKGWLHGTQSHLSFLPAHATDFIFAVSGEELGLLGCTLIIIIFLAIVGRCIYMSSQAQTSFNRLLSGSLSLIFILSAFTNIGMVIGILPVVGVPLPLISYGGSSMLITMIGFGMIMSIHTHRQLWSS